MNITNWIPAFAGYMFSQPPATVGYWQTTWRMPLSPMWYPTFASIPKACGFEAATHFPLTLLCGSLIGDCRVSPMGMAFPWLNTYFAAP
ncbi:MAG: hypothetical protein ACYS6K_27890 [Planctomycetota bacterium]